jgi:glycogen operon protein
MIEKGWPDTPGATFDGDGVNFAVYSGGAEGMELCLFDDDHRQVRTVQLTNQSDGTWHGYLPGCKPGQRYGYRAHGPYSPQQGLRFNPHKLLIDPFARDLAGEFRWSPEVFDFAGEQNDRRINTSDSAAFIPKSVVCGGSGPALHTKPVVPWSQTVIYEANVRGYTMRHPDIADSDRGRFRGLSNGAILSHLKALGITSIELMPVQEFVDEEFLFLHGLRNYWGYNSINFFVPAGRLCSSDRRAEFRDMVNAIHDAGIEVILDVAYNHTGESDTFGPTLSFRGLDNLCYYRTVQGAPGEYVNDTGCGNTVNVDHPRVRELVLSSLRYWAGDMGVDGFRFDLATILGRHDSGFNFQHPLLQAIENDKFIAGLKLIAEPWDPGPGGYRLGGFSEGWSEWNDRFRDSARRFWRGDAGEAPEFARRLHGSSDVFEGGGRTPSASINLLTAHDGFTLLDLVSFNERHNEANGEDNRDGHSHNFSFNHGVEGATGDEAINALRRRQRLNLLASLIFAQGTPMLLAGDEFGNTQHGNNNAYAQDNETGWVDWSGLEADRDFFDTVRSLIRIRHRTTLMHLNAYRHDQPQDIPGWRDIEWLRPDGEPMLERDWPVVLTITMIISSLCGEKDDGAFALICNASPEPVNCRLPDAGEYFAWELAAASCDECKRMSAWSWQVPARAVAAITLRRHSS